VYDVAIVGLGAMGACAAWALAERRVRVVGFDRFTPPHGYGSSHGHSRIIRRAYYEGARYVPLANRAYERWERLERATGERLFHRCGVLNIGERDGRLVTGASRSAEAFGIPYERISADEVMRRHPAFRLPSGFAAVYEPDAGYLVPERCIAAAIGEASRGGADLRTGDPVVDWEVAGDGRVNIRTATTAVAARRLILSSGAWMGSLARCALPLSVERLVAFWFEPSDSFDRFSERSLPAYIVHGESGRNFYGFPSDARYPTAVKVAFDNVSSPSAPDGLDRTVTDEEIARIAESVRSYLPSLPGRCIEHSVCMYTCTPDDDFVIDRHPEHPEVILASPCSGHGFKFAAGIGEILGMMAMGETPAIDLSPFRVARFSS
jgi:sarcosine oxidase